MSKGSTKKIPTAKATKKPTKGGKGGGGKKC